jgi:hypothetical protein
MAKLSANKRNEVFRMKKIRPDNPADPDIRDEVSWLSFMNDGTVLKKYTYKGWKFFGQRWETESTGWKVWQKYGHGWADVFPQMKAQLLGQGWEVA